MVVSSLSFGSYFAYDAIGPISTSLEMDLGFDWTEIGLLYSMYSVPNFFMPLLGGVITDKLGVTKSSLLFSILTTLGAAITAFSGKLWVMLIGRFIFGLGSESMMVAQGVTMAKWFKKTYFATAMGFCLLMMNFGTMAALNTLPYVSENFGWQLPLWIATGTCCFSLLGNVVYVLMDYYGYEASGLKDDADDDKDMPFSPRLLEQFSFTYFSTVIMSFCFYACVLTFVSFSTDVIADRYDMSLEKAGRVGSIVSLSMMALGPLMGFTVDKIGRRSTFMLLGSSLAFPALVAMTFDLIGLRFLLL